MPLSNALTMAETTTNKKYYDIPNSLCYIRTGGNDLYNFVRKTYFLSSINVTLYGTYVLDNSFKHFLMYFSAKAFSDELNWLNDRFHLKTPNQKILDEVFNNKQIMNILLWFALLNKSNLTAANRNDAPYIYKEKEYHLKNDLTPFN